MRLKIILLALSALLLVQCSNPKSSSERQVVSIFDAWYSLLQDNDGDGYYSKVRLSFDIDVNRGSIEVDVLLGIRPAGSTGSYTLYGYIDNLAIEGDTDADTSYMTIGAPYDELDYGRYDLLLQIYPADDDEADPYTEISKDNPDYAGLGNIGLEPADSDMPFQLSFVNPVFTPIEVTVNNIGTAIVDPGSTYTFNLSMNPGIFTYHAETSAKDGSGNQIGLKIIWDYTHDVSAQTSASYTLVVLPDYFFIYIRNTGTLNQNPIYVNYGDNTYQTMVDVIIPPDAQTYRLGYFHAFEGTEIRAYTQGTSNYFWWRVSSTITDLGYFALPWTNNQYVTLVSSPVSAKATPAGNFVADAVNPAPITINPQMAIRAEEAPTKITVFPDAQIDYGTVENK